MVSYWKDVIYLEFALYKGDNLLSMGTIEEIAKEMNIKESTVLFYRTPSSIAKYNGRGRVLIPIEYDDTE